MAGFHDDSVLDKNHPASTEELQVARAWSGVRLLRSLAAVRCGNKFSNQVQSGDEITARQGWKRELYWRRSAGGSGLTIVDGLKSEDDR